MRSRGSSLKELVAVARVANGDIVRIQRYAPTAQGLYGRAGKRLLDICLAIPLLLVAIPIIAVAASAVVLTSGWPAFYRARRVGKDGREFSMWKLRTMCRDADGELARWQITQPHLFKTYQRDFKLSADPRVTAIGKFLRQSSLDELPQLINIIRGEMSLVGPRPYMRSELDLSPTAAARIGDVRPGLTGPWQVRGRNSLRPRDRMQIDQEYVQDYSLRGDMRCLLMTVMVVIRRGGL
jgi:undecaprenyl-phosphate galactose phosphotransferase